MKSGGGVSPLTKSLLLASLLHAGFLAYMAYQARHGRPRPPPQETLLWVETPVEPPPAESEPQPTTPAEGEASGAEPRVAALAPHGHSGQAEPLSDGEGEGEGAVEPEAPGDGEPEGEAEAPQRPRLSLDQLGIGNSQMFWDKEMPKPLSKKARLEKKLRQSLGTAIAQQDQTRGLGPEGPVLKRLEIETRSAATPPRSSVLFRVVTDRHGRVVSLTVMNASGDRKRWDEVAKRTLAALAGTELRTKAPNGVTFDIRVVSRITLPSGADPGFNLSAGGVPITGGEGSRAAGVDILPGDGEMVSTDMPESANGNLPGIETGKQLGGRGDLSDIGAVAQRMVHAFVERLWANDPPADGGAPN